MNFSHEFIGDLEISLASPDAPGTNVLILDPTGSGTSLVGIVDDQDGADFSPATDGALDGFIGQASTGDWVLTVTDTIGASEGCLIAWSLLINTPTFVDPGGLACPVGGAQPFFVSTGSVGLVFGSAPVPPLGPDTVSSTLLVPAFGAGGGGIVTDLRLRVDISHTFISDVELSLSSPLGTTALLSDNFPGPTTPGDDMRVILDDAAALRMDLDFSGEGKFPFISSCS